ncbi:uncharacterized protein LTR77_004710 [Saxophila tyrrhenica]|uniref:SET domain-containing protein n=1 Tax=Saxophila tyrrhenica TaxID=1690608 RepID=A0AAV9PAC1_9PEZI|nr:hypothetical protein LTR77_004710 [Saxophila tyrrhenica]
MAPYPRTKFLVEPTPPNGLDVLATEHVIRGELIMSDKPILCYAGDDGPLHTNGGISPQISLERYEKLFRDFDRLPYEQRRMYDCLVHHKHFDQQAEQYTHKYPTTQKMDREHILVYGKFEQNAFVEQNLAAPREQLEKPKRAVFVDAARFNHSCTPNAFAMFDCSAIMTDEWRLHVRALREIDMGEEITIAYVPVLVHPVGRNNDLMKKFSFKCRCKACGPKEGVAKLGWTDYEPVSASRRHKLYFLDLTFVKESASEPEGPEAEELKVTRRIELLEQRLALMTEEGVEGLSKSEA